MDILKNLLPLLLIFSLAGSCKSTADNPGATAKAFLEAFSERDFAKASTFATKDSKTLLDLVKSMMEMRGDFSDSETWLGKEFLKNAVYENELIEGDNATVKVISGNKTHLIKLKKEEGAWKVAMDKDTLEKSLANETDSLSNKFSEPQIDSNLPGGENSADTAGQQD